MPSLLNFSFNIKYSNIATWTTSVLLSEVPTTKFENLNKYNNTKVNIVCGGPPCQGYSVFGKRRFINTRDYKPREDQRNKLVFAFVDCVARLKPKWVIMENVAGFKSLDDGNFKLTLIDELKALGYTNLEWKIFAI